MLILSFLVNIELNDANEFVPTFEKRCQDTQVNLENETSNGVIFPGSGIRSHLHRLSLQKLRDSKVVKEQQAYHKIQR